MGVMELDNLADQKLILKRCKEDLVITTFRSEKDTSENTVKFRLSSLFHVLEGGKLSRLQPSLNNITTIDLSHSALPDLPKCLKILNLTELNLSNNKFTQVPLCLYGGGLQTLEILDLSFNQINQFDIEPDCVLSLKRLKLNNNLFENVPKWFLTFRCTNLKEFNYSDNKATHYNFLKNSFNFSFMKLKKLELQNSCLIDKDITWLKTFRHLKLLDISNKSILRDIKYVNKFKELDQLFVKPEWQEMQILKLNYLDLAFFPEGVFWIESLSELHINNNSLSWFPDGLQYLVNLKVLDISNNEIIAIPQQISQLSCLYELIAYGNRIEEVPLMPANVEILDLYNNYLEVLNSENIKCVQFLDLEYNCLNLEEYNGYNDWCKKRDMLRDLYGYKDRCKGVKIKDERDSSVHSDYSDLDDHEYNIWDVEDTLKHSLRIQIPEENWDDELLIKPKIVDPHITTSDNEWEGDIEQCSKQGFCLNLYKNAKVYVNDEDWMFVDAD